LRNTAFGKSLPSLFIRTPALGPKGNARLRRVYGAAP
jgi:hypothetical protein